MISALPRPHPTFPTLALTPTAHTYPANMRFLNCLRFYFSDGLIQILPHVYGVPVRVMVSARLRMEVGLRTTTRTRVVNADDTSYSQYGSYGDNTDPSCFLDCV